MGNNPFAACVKRVEDAVPSKYRHYLKGRKAKTEENFLTKHLRNFQRSCNDDKESRTFFFQKRNSPKQRRPETRTINIGPFSFNTLQTPEPKQERRKSSFSLLTLQKPEEKTEQRRLSIGPITLQKPEVKDEARRLSIGPVTLLQVPDQKSQQRRLSSGSITSQRSDRRLSIGPFTMPTIEFSGSK